MSRQIYFIHFTKVGMLNHILRWLSHSGVSSGWRWDVLCQRRAYAESALPRPMSGRPWAMAELKRRALCWHGTSRRHLQETDEPNQAFLLLWNGGSILLLQQALSRVHDTYILDWKFKICMFNLFSGQNIMPSSLGKPWNTSANLMMKKKEPSQDSRVFGRVQWQDSRTANGKSDAAG